MRTKKTARSRALAVAKAAALCAGLSLLSCTSEEQVCIDTQGAEPRYRNGQYVACCWPGDVSGPPYCCGYGCGVPGPFVPPRAQARRRRVSRRRSIFR